MLVNEGISFDDNDPEGWAEVHKGGLPSRGMFQEILLSRISIAETKDKGDS